MTILHADLPELKIPRICPDVIPEIKHSVSVTEDEVFFTGYMLSKLVYAIKSSLKDFAKEQEEIKIAIMEAIHKTVLYDTPEHYLAEQCLEWEHRVILYSGNTNNLLVEDYMRLLKEKILFYETGFDWETIEQQVCAYEKALNDKQHEQIVCCSLQLRLLNNMGCLLFSKNESLKRLFKRYLKCSEMEEEYFDFLVQEFSIDISI